VRNFRETIEREFLHKVCISHNVSGIKCTYPMMNTRRKSNYIEDPKIANIREASNQKDPTNQLNKRFYDLIK